LEKEIVTTSSAWLVTPQSTIEERFSDMMETLRITGSISIAKRKAYVSDIEWESLVDKYPSVLKAVGKIEAEFEESMVGDLSTWRPEARLQYLSQVMPDRYGKNAGANIDATDGQLLEVLVRIKA
jgi:hypothetical protein